MRIALLLVTACGRIGFDPRASDGAVSIDGPIAGLCKNSSLDGNRNGIPDACDGCLAGPSCNDQGVPSGGLPTYSERVMMVGWNMVRTDPGGFRDQYMAFGDTTGSMVYTANPPSQPLLQENGLTNAGAHAHTKDRVSCPGSAQPLFSYCDGTDYPTWSAPYQPIDNATDYVLGPVPWVPDLPMRVVSASVCGGQLASTSEKVFNCVDDTKRTAFLDPSNHQIGTGEAFDGVDYTLWDYLLTNANPSFTYPIATAGHFLYRGQIELVVELDVATAPLGVYLAIDGQLMPMTVGLGIATRGTYRVVQPIGNACRSYHFIVQLADSQIWRYPASGELRTTGESCQEEWIP